MRVDGKWKEEAQIEKQSGQGEEGEECVEASWRLSRSIGGLLGAMGLFRGVLGSSWGSLGHLGALFGLFGGSWGPLGALLERLGALVGLSWGSLGGPLGALGLPGAILEAIDQKKEWTLFGSPRRGPQMSLLGPSWGALGALLGALGPFLGPSWAPLGALLGHLGTILRPQKPIRSEKGRGPKALMFFRFLKDFGLSGASLGDSLAS